MFSIRALFFMMIVLFVTGCSSPPTPPTYKGAPRMPINTPLATPVPTVMASVTPT